MAMHPAAGGPACHSLLWAESWLDRCCGVFHRCDGHLLGHLWLEALSQLTMASSFFKPLKTDSVINRDSEAELVDRLTAAIARTGIQADRIDIASFYVALKRTPKLA